MNIRHSREFFRWGLPLVFALAACLAPSTHAAQTRNFGTSRPGLSIPPGTILPARLNQSFSSKNTKPGQLLTARIMQDVPLPNGQKIPAGSKLTGEITAVQSSGKGTPPRIELRFDTLLVRRQSIPITTSLRALAGFMEVQAAQTPEFSPGFGTPSTWITTQQIGGDEVFGVAGPVTNQNMEHVGIGVNDGVLVHVRARPDSKCRGAWDEEDRLQALWVFSADACGVYGLDDVEIAHAGTTDPAGAIVLTTQGKDLKLRAGDALLLRAR
ncbi:MAG TPA: TrbI/VirB10 family protein [Terriglobales bacterium]|nr:TrbI/VirB10 family protein [Terriglobales bacterium]